MDPDSGYALRVRIWIRNEVQRGIRIRIKVMRIRNPGRKDQQLQNLPGTLLPVLQLRKYCVQKRGEYNPLSKFRDTAIYRYCVYYDGKTVSLQNPFILATIFTMAYSDAE
jgi:hypothetical protein